MWSQEDLRSIWMGERWLGTLVVFSGDSDWGMERSSGNGW